MMAISMETRRTLKLNGKGYYDMEKFSTGKPMFNSNMVDHRKWWLNDDRYLTPETQARLTEMQAAQEIRDEDELVDD